MEAGVSILREGLLFLWVVFGYEKQVKLLKIDFQKKWKENTFSGFGPSFCPY
jgi:hypothetical protein